MKKGIFCLVLGIVGLGLMSCGDDESKWSSLCDTMFEQSDYRTTNLLTNDQKSELKKVYHDECLNYYENYPVCENETYDFLDCRVNITDAEWEVFIDKEEECSDQYEEDLYDYTFYEDCVAKFYPCAALEKKLGECEDANEAAYNKYQEDYYSQEEDPIEKLLMEWGIK